MNFYFLILESIGTPELILILVVALIILGPRKLPQVGRQMAKYMAEFKRTSQEFRQTWEREVAMEELSGNSLAEIETNELSRQPIENTIGRSSARRVTTDASDAAADSTNANVFDADNAFNNNDSSSVIAPINGAPIDNSPAAHESVTVGEPIEPTAERKREWL